MTPRKRTWRHPEVRAWSWRNHTRDEWGQPDQVPLPQHGQAHSRSLRRYSKLRPLAISIKSNKQKINLINKINFKHTQYKIKTKNYQSEFYFHGGFMYMITWKVIINRISEIPSWPLVAWPPMIYKNASNGILSHVGLKIYNEHMRSMVFAMFFRFLTVILNKDINNFFH